MRALRVALLAVVALGAVAALIGAFSPQARNATNTGAFVRVNQVGYPIGASKRAYVMARVAETGATFAVRENDGEVVYSAPIGDNLGSWSTRYPFVYALDFTGVKDRGMYSITVDGPRDAASPAFAIAHGSALYRQPLANALAFYQNERDGKHFIPSDLRTAPAHLNDAHAMTYLTPQTDADGFFQGDLTPLGTRIDASGGWWDAGDYPKFVETTSYAVDLLLAGVRDFPGSMGLGAADSNFTAEAKFGNDWLGRMWDDSTRTLYYQVGIGEGNDTTVGDHDIWRLPQADDTYGGTDPQYRYIRNRPVFRAAPPGSPVSPNIAGRDAAAFALCYQVFRQIDPAYAARCLRMAEHVYALADRSPSGDLLTVVPFDFYGETEWRDDLELGATELARALMDGTPPAGLPHSAADFYLRDAAHWANAYINGPNDAADSLNLYDVSGFAHYELYRAIVKAGSPGGLEVTKAALLADLKKQLDSALVQAGTDPFQFGFPWATWDTTSHGAGLAVMASEYDQLTGTHAYADWSSRWLSNILGANAWGTSLIVGDGSTYPACMQHQVANLAGSLDGSPPILAGAAVEGPNSFSATGAVDGMKPCPPDGGNVFKQFNSTAVYKDNVEAYSNVEPAIDLTASSPLAFARLAAGLY